MGNGYRTLIGFLGWNDAGRIEEATLIHEALLLSSRISYTAYTSRLRIGIILLIYGPSLHREA